MIGEWGEPGPLSSLYVSPVGCCDKTQVHAHVRPHELLFVGITSLTQRREPHLQHEPVIRVSLLDLGSAHPEKNVVE